MPNAPWIDHSSLRQHVGPGGVAKRGFDDEESAAAYAAELQAKPTASKRRPYRAYPCSVCGRWHAGRRKP